MADREEPSSRPLLLPSEDEGSVSEEEYTDADVGDRQGSRVADLRINELVKGKDGRSCSVEHRGKVCLVSCVGHYSDNDEPSQSESNGVKHKAERPTRACFCLPYCFPMSVFHILLYAFFQSYAYYGLTAILAVYFSGYLDYSQNTSVSLVHYFISGTFFFSIPGGIVSDRLGKFWGIAIGLVLWFIGNAGLSVLSWADFRDWEYLPYVIFPSLAILAIGKGAVTPSNSGFLGDQMPVKSVNDEERASSAYAWFYFMISVGSLVGKWVTPLLKNKVPEGEGEFTAIGSTTVAVLSGTLIFVLGYCFYRRTTDGRNALWDVIQVVWAALKNRNIPYLDGEHKGWLRKARLTYSDECVDEVTALLKVSVVLLPLPIFWSLFFQTYSTWVFQADTMNKMIGPYEISSEQTQTLNPLMDMALIPLLTYLIYPCIRCMRFRVTTLRRMVAGMFFASMSFIVAAVVQYAIDNNPVTDPKDRNNGVSVLWQIPQYFLLSLAEVLFSIAGLEFAYTEAPQTMKTAVQALWYFCVGIGNILVAVIARLDICSAFCQFFMYAGLMFFFMLVFLLIASRYKYVNNFETSFSTDDTTSDHHHNQPPRALGRRLPSSPSLSSSIPSPLLSPRYSSTSLPTSPATSVREYRYPPFPPSAFVVAPNASGRMRPFQKQVSVIMN